MIRRVNYTDQPQAKFERNIDWMCDRCGGLLETMTNVFSEALRELRANNWTSRKQPDGKWRHYCEECRSEAEAA